MPLLVNGDWNSTDDDKKIRSSSSDHAESNCDGHATPAPNRAPKAVNPSTADQWQIGSLGGCGWSEKTKGIMGNKTQVAMWPNSGENVPNWGRDSVKLQGFDRWSSNRFLATWMIGKWSALHELLIGTKIDRWGGWK